MLNDENGRYLITRSFVDRIGGKKYNMIAGTRLDELPPLCNWLAVGFAIDTQAPDPDDGADEATAGADGTDDGADEATAGAETAAKKKSGRSRSKK